MLLSSLQRKALALYLLRKRRSRQRQCHVRAIYKSRKQHGVYFTLEKEMREPVNHDQFYNYFRMLPADFDRILSLISPHIQKNDAGTEPVTPGEMLAVTLRFLASGDSMASVSYAFRLGRSTVSQIINSTCNAIWEQLKEICLPVPNEDHWKRVSEDFETLWNMPLCFGAVDGKHVLIQAPPNSGSDNFNYKKSFSIVLMAICDANYRFVLVDIGAKGRQSDGGIFRASVMGQKLFSNDLNIPLPKPLRDGDEEISYYLVGDEAFPLHTHIMRPYPGRFLSQPKRIFNYRLSRARRIVENTFGILVAKWRIFRKPIIASVDTAEKIIQATVCLHNFLKMEDEQHTARKYCTSADIDREDDEGNRIDGNWRKESGNQNLLKIKMGGNFHSSNAARMRDYLMQYFINHSPINSQWDK